MSQELLFPRRRDVRDLAEWLLHALMTHYDNEREEEFDQSFLTAVRDLMRDGVPFYNAICTVLDAFANDHVTPPQSSDLYDC